MQASAEDLEFDPEDADICNDLDDFLEQATSARCNPASGPRWACGTPGVGFGECPALQRHGCRLINKASGNKWFDAHRARNAASLSPSSSHLHGALQGHMQVRFMDWRSDLERLHSQSRASQATSTLLIEPERLKSIPGIQEDATFDVVLGSDILYEVCLALLDSPGVSMQLG